MRLQTTTRNQYQVQGFRSHDLISVPNLDLSYKWYITKIAALGYTNIHFKDR